MVRRSAEPIRKVSLPAEAIDEVSQLTQSLEVEEERSGAGGKGYGGVRGVVGRVEGNGRMAAIRQPDDDVRAGAATDTDDGELLAAQRVMGMRDGHVSRRELGSGGSALGMCQL